MRPRRLSALLLATAVLVLPAGCGDSDDDSDTTATDTAAAPAAPSADVDTSKKPKIEVPDGQPPAGLEIEDLKVGEGQTARAGDSVTVEYVGVLHSSGAEFDSSWDPEDAPFSFSLGSGGVIPGWDQGVAGMKVGGRRQLTIPPDLAYGEQGFPPDIPPNSTLIFVVDLVSIA